MGNLLENTWCRGTGTNGANGLGWEALLSWEEDVSLRVERIRSAPANGSSAA